MFLALIGIVFAQDPDVDLQCENDRRELCSLANTLNGDELQSLLKLKENNP